METIACTLCGTTDSKIYQQLNDRFTGDSFQLHLCNNCGLIYLNPRPTPDEINRYYPTGYEPHHTANTSTDQWHKKRMHQIQLHYVETKRPQKGTLLDIGCATGDFLKEAKDNEWYVQGIEMIPEAAQVARNQYNLPILTGAVESIPLPVNKFDVITLWDVVEHLTQPAEVFNRCFQALKPDGWLIFAIPNLSSFDRFLFGNSWVGWEAPRHYYFFTEQTLSQMMHKTGFKLIDTKCLVGGKGVFQLSFKTRFQKSNFWPLLEKILPLLLTILWPYRQLSYRMNKGSVITYAAQKQSA
jgi:2-polyprenyl-3-methyl-5-hydroxy-6-metoxy-1,4-benzoquinol methylase